MTQHPRPFTHLVPSAATRAKAAKSAAKSAAKPVALEKPPARRFAHLKGVALPAAAQAAPEAPDEAAAIAAAMVRNAGRGVR